MSFNTGVSIVPEFHMRRITPELNMLIGKSSFLELGYSYAIDPLYYSKSNNIKTKFQPGRPFSSWRIGIRLQQPRGGVMYRFAFTPLNGFYYGKRSFWFGLSVGYTFHKSRR